MSKRVIEKEREKEEKRECETHLRESVYYTDSYAVKST